MTTTWSTDAVELAFACLQHHVESPIAKPDKGKQPRLTKVPKTKLLAEAALLKVGFEFTFVHKSKKERERRDEVVVGHDLQALIIAKKYFDKPVRELARYFKTDDECIECSYPPTLDLDVQINLFNDLKALLHPWVPYLSDSKPEGGMHINVDGYRSNIKRIIKAIPAISWVFAPANDYETCQINGWYKTAAVWERSNYTEYRCVATVNDGEHVRLAAEFFRRLSAYVRHCSGFNSQGDVKYSIEKNPFDQELAKFNRLLERLHLDPSDYEWFVDSHMRNRYIYEARQPGKFLN